MLGYEASDQEVNNSQCYIWVEVQCIDTKGIAISLGTFNLTQNFNGEDQTCTFNPLNHQAFLLALNSSTSYSFPIFSKLANINMMFEFYNATS